jgi:hypothetical protein
MTNKANYLILLTIFFSDSLLSKEIFYSDPIVSDIFHIKKDEHLIINTNTVVEIRSKKIIIDGKLSVRERLFESREQYVYGKLIKRIFFEGTKGEDVLTNIGGKPSFGNGGGGATSFSNGVNADLKGDTINVLYGNDGSVVVGGQGGLAGLSGGVLYLNSPSISVKGIIDLKGLPASNPTMNIKGEKELKHKCEPYECCLESGSKGKCLEIGTCYKECVSSIMYEIGKGGSGGKGSDGYLFLNNEKVLNTNLKVENIIVLDPK